MVPHEQQHIMRDFLGLGNLETGDGGQDTADREVPIPSFGGSINMELAPGVKNCVCSIGLPTDEGHGLAYTRQWALPGALASQMRSPSLNNTHAKSSGGTQLTIFYGGNVNVYNNISANTAEAIMLMATTGNSSPSVTFSDVVLGTEQVAYHMSSVGGENLFLSNAQIGQPHFGLDHGNQNCPPVSNLCECVTPSTPASGNQNRPHASNLCECVTPSTPASTSSPQPMVPRALPLARKASLARFFEKRKERIQKKAPYLKQQLAIGKFPCPGGTAMTFNHGTAFTGMYEDLSKKPIFSAMPESVAVRCDMPSWRYFVKH